MAGETNLEDFRSFYDRGELDGDNVGGLECPDLDFVYADADTHPNEIAELYSYTEQPEFQLNVRAFEEQMLAYGVVPQWQKLSAAERRGVVLKLLDALDLSDRALRMKAARCLLYLAQGCFAEVQSDQEQQLWTRNNVMLLYELGVFGTFVELLGFEIENTYTADVAIRKVANSLADSVDLRIVLSVLYIVTEVMRAEKSADGEFQHHVDDFVVEINQPIGEELLSVKLLGMITRFCSGLAPHFPMKKVLLLLWKISLVGLGGMQTLRELKDKYRAENKLNPTKEDTLEVARTMRASSPPANNADILDSQMPKRNRPLRRQSQSLMKQSSLDEHEQLGMELESQQADAEEENADFFRTYDDPNVGGSSAPGPGGQKEPYSPVVPMRLIDRLPWTPKVRQKDIDQFLDASRSKFIGFTLPDDHQSLAGLPDSIHEGFRTLNRHMYVSLADVQIKREEEYARNPLLYANVELNMTPVEVLYQAILPNLPQYMIALLKILLAAAPTSKAKTESINIMADVLPEEMPMTVTQSTKLGIDVNRHKEIIVKAVSAILLLYLKHFKINHIYQFEFMSQHLVFANCIPLVLKFFNQHILTHIGSKNSIPIIDFPACILGEPPELTTDSLVIGDSAAYSWRNVFACINLLRILNKLTKWKHSRIMMLVVFKSSPILKRTLRVRHAMMQLYVLKLLKMQTKYLGRQWRKTNMKIISSIYAKVRHRLNDDWAFGNDLDARPWDFQAEECSLRACVDRFNSRRYLACNFVRTAGVGGGGGGASNGGNASNGNAGGSNSGFGQSGGSTASGANGANGGDLNEYGEPMHALDANGAGGILMSGIGGIVGGTNGVAGERLVYAPGYGGWDTETVELSEEFKRTYGDWLQQEVFSQQINWDALITNVEY